MSDETTLIYSGTAEWNAWINRYEATWPKQHMAMMNAMAAVTQRRARWLLALLLEIFSSDIAAEDVTIDQSEQRTAVLIRGVPVREFTMRAMFAVPAQLPPNASAQQRLRQISGGPPKPAAPEPAAVRIAGRPHVRKIGGAKPVPGMPMIFEYEGREIITADGKNPFPPERMIIESAPLDKKMLAASTVAEFETTRHRRAGLATEEAILAGALEAARHDDFPDVAASELLDTILVADPLEAYYQELIGSGPAMIIPRKDAPLRQRVIALRDDPLGKMAKRGGLYEVKPPPGMPELSRRCSTLEAALDDLPAIGKQTSEGDAKRIDRRRRQITAELRGVETEIAALVDLANARGEEEKQIRVNAARFYEGIYLTVEIGGARAIDPSRIFVTGGSFVTPDTDTRLAAQRWLAKIDAALGSDAVDLVRAVLVQKWEICQIADAQGNDTVRHRRHLQGKLRNALDQIARFVPATPHPAAFLSARDAYAALAAVASNIKAHRALLAAIHAARKA